VSKIANIFKNQKCLSKTVLVTKVVVIGLRKISTIKNEGSNKDKYTPNYLKLHFIAIVITVANLQSCQICCFSQLHQSFSPKIANRRFNLSFQILLVIIKQFLFSKLLQSGDIESNPGPPQKHNVSISTYNARGLKNGLKLKRVLNSCYKIVSKNDCSMIFLQETHLEEMDTELVRMHWRHGFLLSPGTNKQHGCLTLYDTSWEVIDEEIDGIGRFGLVVLRRFEKNYILVNIYAPNDHNLSFFAQVFNRIIEVQIKFPGAEVVLAGDFNFVLNENDAANRNSTNSEIQCRTLVQRNLNKLGLKDCYRSLHPHGGFTWKRLSCMSRLDMIFVTDSIINNITSASLDWSFDDSDHALLSASFRIPVVFGRGPGLLRLNTDYLDDPLTLQTIKEELDFQINQIPGQWDPHFKLDFIKSSIRSVIAVISGKQKKIENFEQESISEQLNILLHTKEQLESGNMHNPPLLLEVNSTIELLEAERNKYLDKVAKNLSIRAQVKWYEEGERSNKYFLSLINKRMEQKLITKLRSGETTYESQDEIMEHVTDFYKQLYDHKETDENFDSLLSDLPTLNNEDRSYLDREITLEELKLVIDSCDETAPGPDGIPYKVYKRLWSTVGQHLLDAWKYSLSIGLLPLDQRISAITLLPKSGKTLDRIENWRPITLSNCDLKIFTKLISNRVSKVLDKLIHPSQTAYIPGRIVHDNLRMFDFYNNYCKENNVDALLISLDAKKAFDSVSHKYLHKVLSSYGFSDNFIDTIKVLYRDIKANILVNGYKSTMINILRSVKQGDALSCALFILCIDPLIRKIQNNPEIKPVQIPRSQISNINLSSKIAGFADDIGMAVNNDENTISNIFKDYKTFSNLSGIELNLDKTEILKMNIDSLHSDFVPQRLTIGGETINTVESLDICGICFSNNANIAYDKNVIDKIIKLEKQLIRWLQRPLSMEGKILIVKTFGLSQLLYSMQMCDFNEQELINIERIIFKYLWNKKWVGNSAPDRIKRSTLKQSYSNGGLNAPDIANMNAALKVKQFLRAMKAEHPISLIQKYQLEKIGYDEYYKCEYAKICKKDPVIATFQRACNILTDQFRSHCSQLPLQDPDSLHNVFSIIASTDVLEYLMRRKEILLINRYAALVNIGVQSYRQLFNESKYPRDDYLGNLATYITSFFPPSWRTIMELNTDIDSTITYENEFPNQNLQLSLHNNITVKSLRLTFLEATTSQPHPFLNNEKFQLSTVDQGNPFSKARKFYHMPRDRFFKYRILQGDIFCKQRMFKFKMVNSDICDYCNIETESIKHMIWSCPRARDLWTCLEQIITRSYGISYITYETIILGSQNPIPILENIILIALKLIMSIDRSQSIESDQLVNKIKKLYTIEKYAFKNKRDKFTKRWRLLEGTLFSG